MPPHENNSLLTMHLAFLPPGAGLTTRLGYGDIWRYPFGPDSIPANVNTISLDSQFSRAINNNILLSGSRTFANLVVNPQGVRVWQLVIRIAVSL
jgi:hypothetical protein